MLAASSTQWKSNFVTFCRLLLSSHKGLCLLPLNQANSSAGEKRGGLCSGLTLAFIAKQLGCFQSSQFHKAKYIHESQDDVDKNA